MSIFLYNLALFAQAPRGYYALAGLSQTNLKSKDLLSDSKPGFVAGIIGQMGYHENYNFQIEFLYRQNTLGVKYVEDTFAEAKTSNYKCSNLELGFYTNYYIIKPDEDKFFIGPQAGIYIAVLDPLTPSKGVNVNGQYYLPYLLDESDLSDSGQFNFGFGLGLTGGYNRFRFDLRYSIGMSNILSEVETNSYTESNLYTGPTLEGKITNITFGISYQVFSRGK